LKCWSSLVVAVEAVGTLEEEVLADTVQLQLHCYLELRAKSLLAREELAEITPRPPQLAVKTVNF
jgi:hypothetical protein